MLLVISVVEGAAAVHRVIALLHRKNVLFTAIVCASGTVIVQVPPTSRPLGPLIAAVEREPVVLSVTARPAELPWLAIQLDRSIAEARNAAR